jgi:hypothetical protein
VPDGSICLFIYSFISFLGVYGCICQGLNLSVLFAQVKYLLLSDVPSDLAQPNNESTKPAFTGLSTPAPASTTPELALATSPGPAPARRRVPSPKLHVTLLGCSELKPGMKYTLHIGFLGAELASVVQTANSQVTPDTTATFIHAITAR